MGKHNANLHSVASGASSPSPPAASIIVVSVVIVVCPYVLPVAGNMGHSIITPTNKNKMVTMFSRELMARMRRKINLRSSSFARKDEVSTYDNSYSKSYKALCKTHDLSLARLQLIPARKENDKSTYRA